MFYFTRSLDFNWKNPLAILFFPIYAVVLLPIAITFDLITLPIQLFFSLCFSFLDATELKIVSASEKDGVRHLLVTNSDTDPEELMQLDGTSMRISDFHIVSGFKLFGKTRITVSDIKQQQLEYDLVSTHAGVEHYVEYRTPEQVQALSELAATGLNPEILRSWKRPEAGSFGKGHLKALRFFSHRKMTAQLAVNEINELDDNQANALAQLYDLELRSTHLRSWQKSKHGYFGTGHINALKLLADCGIRAQTAINEINDLDDEQAEVLAQLYTTGLRGRHLRSWSAPKDETFGGGQADALKLLADQGITGQAAINFINGLDGSQLKQKFRARNGYSGAFFGANGQASGTEDFSKEAINHI